MTILFAVVGPRPNPYPKVRTEFPQPPSGLMPRPRVLLIKELPKGQGWLLIGHAADGGFSGDSWHATLADAQQDAFRSYGNALSEWRDCETSDLRAAVISALAYARKSN